MFWRSHLPVLACFILTLLIVLPASLALAQRVSAVQVDAVRQEPLAQTVPIFGRLVSKQSGHIAALINGPVSEYFVEVGDRVERGEVLAVLHSQLLTARRDLAKGELREAQADLATAQAEATLAGQELQRMNRLQSSAAFSQARFDDLSQELVIAQAKVRSGEGAVASARAELAVTEINLANAIIVAPFSGVVIQRLSEAGAYVRVGDPLVALMADRSLEIEAEVPFKRLAGLSSGSQVPFELDDGSWHQATVRAILPNENPLTRTRVVRFTPEFGSTATALADSQSVTVQVPVGTARDVLTVHKDAILRRQGGVMVFVVKEDKAVATTITVGEAVGPRLEVLSGLIEGDAVVVRGNERLRDGSAVSVNGSS